jgi:hypothetical protein
LRPTERVSHDRTHRPLGTVPDTPCVTEAGCTAPGVHAIFHVVDDQTDAYTTKF